jgi:N-methylhydantoinase B/oxoprolinase/acetone carboxylase alpha subunit
MIVNGTFPAPVAGGNTETSPRLTDMVFGALQDAIPDRVVGSCGGTSSPFLFGGTDPRTGDLYAHFHFEGVGWGGRSHADGNDMVVTINGNCRNTPVEVFEHRYPLLTLRYGLARDSGGAGRHRGGLGTERLFRITAPDITFSALFDRCKLAPPGLFGGHSGGRSALLVKRAGTSEFQRFDQAFGVASPTKFTNVVLHQGDELYYRTPGGGGLGDPAERDPALVAEDVREGYVSAAAAERDYGPASLERETAE